MESTNNAVVTYRCVRTARPVLTGVAEHRATRAADTPSSDPTA